MTEIIRFTARDSGDVAVGVRHGEEIYPISPTMGQLLRSPLDEIRHRCEHPSSRPAPARDVIELPPIDGRGEVWAAGVTYRRSREARIAESQASADVYARVYDAERPELFFKSASWRVVGPGEPIAIRSDSRIDVPEPELALILNASGETVGYSICNDVSSRDIEGENPLYLPQAKTYLGSCALGPVVRPAWEIEDPYALGIAMSITRDGKPVWSGQTNTSLLHRRYDDLVNHLLRDNLFPDGVALSTGTCLVPGLDTTLQAGDLVEIVIDGIGTLANRVVRGTETLNWLAAERQPRPPRA